MSCKIETNATVGDIATNAPQYEKVFTIVNMNPIDLLPEPKIKCMCCKKLHYSNFVKHGRVNNKFGMICDDCRAKGKGR